MRKITIIYPIIVMAIFVIAFLVNIHTTLDEFKNVKEIYYKAEKVLSLNKHLIEMTVYASETYIDALSDNVYELGTNINPISVSVVSADVEEVMKINCIKDNLGLIINRIFENFDRISNTSGENKNYERVHSNFLSAMNNIELLNDSIGHAFFKFENAVDHRTYFYYQKVLNLIYYISLERSLISGFMFVQNHRINNNELDFINKKIESLWQEISGFDDIILDKDFKNSLNNFHEEYMNKYIKTKHQILGVKNDINFSFDLEMFIKQSNKVVVSLIDMCEKLNQRILDKIKAEEENKVFKVLILSIALISEVTLMFWVFFVIIKRPRFNKRIKFKTEELLKGCNDIAAYIKNIEDIIAANDNKNDVILKEDFGSSFIKTKLELCLINLRHELNSGNIKIEAFNRVSNEIGRVVNNINITGLGEQYIKATSDNLDKISIELEFIKDKIFSLIKIIMESKNKQQ